MTSTPGAVAERRTTQPANRHPAAPPLRVNRNRLTVGPASVAQLRAAMTSRVVVQAYRDRIQVPVAGDDCHLWNGARSRTGEGWLWIASGRVVIAHRFGYALAHGVDALLAEPALGHACGNRLCQNLEHIGPAAPDAQRPRPAVVLREAAARDGQCVASAILAGISALRRRDARAV